MKKTFFLSVFILSLIVSISFGQTKKETQDWIKEKIQLYPFANNRVINNFIVEYTEKFIIIKNKHKMIFNQSETSSNSTFYIPIKEMSKITFHDYKSNTHMKISIKSGKKVISVSMRDANNKNEVLSLENNVVILLDKSAYDEDLKNRLSKAFNHLIELYGGTVIKEVF